MAQSDFINFLPLPKEWVIISINKEHAVEMHILTFRDAGETVGGLWSNFVCCQVFSKMLDPRCVQFCSEDPEEPGLGKVTGRNHRKAGRTNFMFLFHFTSTANEKTEKKWRSQQPNFMKVYSLNITFEFCTYRQHNNGVCLLMGGDCTQFSTITD